MIDLAVIILTKNESLHIVRCLERLDPLRPREVFVVDCFSTDGTQEMARHIGATVVEHEWPGNQAAQFNWAIDTLPIESGWVLRLDADEWLTSELVEEIKTRLAELPSSVDGVLLKRRHCVGWLGSKWIKHGMYPTRILRIFRKGKARYSKDMEMDEHLKADGDVVEFDNDFVDESLLSFEEWRQKHCNYAMREAQMVVSGNVNANKRAYYRLPPYLRAFAYFCIRYILKLGFLEGSPGFRWHFWQGLWYRLIVDREIGRMRHYNREKTINA